MKAYLFLIAIIIGSLNTLNAQSRQDEFNKFKDNVMTAANNNGWHWFRTTYFNHNTGIKEVIREMNPNMWVRVTFIQDMDCSLRFGVKDTKGGGVAGLDKDEVKRYGNFLYNTLSFVTKDQSLNFWIRSEGACTDVAGNACMIIFYKTKEEALKK